ncbi:hypothetical protein BT96DRAFT_1070339 [Gymnopus androsaceus JB14]|uniref:Zn(2)-C6 fungal-type domain-containing protein n=1 Tax=Gymnopus androsaceus JB14 TaxID=1447944 RepID=A0A6A4GUI8_9AGAR|nr:hypothetical protein BT96DRAFT_1070339 [Gymnopus androsaceus JB14]
MSYRDGDDIVGPHYKRYPYHNPAYQNQYEQNCSPHILQHPYIAPTSQMSGSFPNQPSHSSPTHRFNTWDSYIQNHRLEGYASSENYHSPTSSYSIHHVAATSLHQVQQQSLQSTFPNSRPVHLDRYAGVQHTLAGSLDPTTGVFYRTPEHPRLRTAQACEKCRTRKAKCSGEHPSCKRCLNRGLVCEYAKEGRVRGPNKPKPKVSGGPASLSPLMLQSQSTVPTSGSDASVSNSTEAPLPRRYVSPSVLPPSMSSSLSSSPSSPHISGSFDALNSPIPSSSSSNSTISSHNPSDSVSLPDTRHNECRPPNLQPSNVYGTISEHSTFRDSARLHLRSHVSPYSEMYADATANATSLTIPALAFNDPKNRKFHRHNGRINSLVLYHDVDGSDPGVNGIVETVDYPYYSQVPSGLTVLGHEMQRPRSYDSFLTSHIHQPHPTFFSHSHENLGESRTYPADVGT